MNTQIGRFRLMDTWYPSKRVEGYEFSSYANVKARADARNSATGCPNRYIVKRLDSRPMADDTAYHEFRMVGAL